MLKFKDFEAINERAEMELPPRVNGIIRKIALQDRSISMDPWPEIVQKEGQDKPMLGLRMYFKNILFRINWRDMDSEPTMIDIWNRNKETSVMPSLTMIGNADLFDSIMPFMLKCIELLSDGKNPFSKFPPEIGYNEGPRRIKKFVKNEAMEIESDPLGNPPKIVPSPPENTDDTLQPQSDIDNSSLNIFDELKTLVTMVVNNVNPSLIITGRGGIGKTHTVLDTFKDYELVKDDEYVIIKGASTALSMYKALFFNNGKIVVFDDCDSIFKDPDGVNILKAALDSYDEREISWLSKSTYDPNTQSPTDSKPVPNRFVFDGQIIFISNMPMEKVDQAIRTRSYTIDINLTEKEMFEIMEKNLPNILPNVDLATKKEVFDYLKATYKSSQETINVRTLIKAIKIRMSGAPNWKVLVTKYA